VTRGPLLIAGALVLVLAAFASRYGYHRDELYFIAAGHHLAWAYADQGPLTPLIARAMSDIAPDSLTVLRLPSALAAGTTVFLTALIARDLGGNRRAELIAAGSAAVGVIVVFTGHLLSTSTFDLLVWTAVTWLVVRAIRIGNDRLWLVAGAVLGVGLLNKPLPAFLAAGMLAGVAISGPRRLLRNPRVWTGAVIALVLWLPWIVWQSDHGWPQIDVSRSIASGASTSSQPWWLLVPFQVLLISPFLAWIWIGGLARLFRDPELRDLRFLGWTWVVLAVVFMASGGKPYYLAGLLPLLLAVGSIAVERSLRAAFVLSAVIGGIVSLPILPAADAGPVVAVNPDVGEMIGWPDFARTLADVQRRLPGRGAAAIFTANYGEAGAVARFGPGLGLPPAYSGHNAYADWGPPPDSAVPVMLVGFGRAYAAAHFAGCRFAARITNRAGVENDEDGEAVMVCARPRRRWRAEWPSLRHLG
jgi:4-amino-4-deoxy-L-arabinose transferase-like glycosyltransferase